MVTKGLVALSTAEKRVVLGPSVRLDVSYLYLASERPIKSTLIVYGSHSVKSTSGTGLSVVVSTSKDFCLLVKVVGIGMGWRERGLKYLLDEGHAMAAR